MLGLIHMDMRLKGLLCNAQTQRILSIGPLIRSSDREFGGGHSMKHQEERACADIFEWLDAQEKLSVVYVSFGSLLTVPETQIHELARGLEVSGRPFLWVYRVPDSPQVLPTETEDALRFDGLPAGMNQISTPFNYLIPCCNRDLLYSD